MRLLRNWHVGFLVLVAGAFLLPAIWMLLTSLKSPGEVFSDPLRLWPQSFSFFDNVREVLKRAPFGQYYINTIIFTGGLAIVQLVLNLPAAYAFARLKFKGRDILFLVMLTKMIVTPLVVFLPNYMTLTRLGLTNSVWGAMLPYFASAMACFLLRQSFRQIPEELFEAARMDGAGNLRCLWYIGIPLVRPTIVTFVIISIVYHWNEFFWPFLVLQVPGSQTLSVGLGRFGIMGDTGAEWVLTMTASFIVCIPMMVAYLVLQRQFLKSFMRSGLK